MVKVLIVMDDYSEAVSVETYLRKTGFDVLTLKNESQFNDAVLGFPPGLLLAPVRGRNVDGLKLASRARKAQNPPKIILCYPAGQPPQLSKAELSWADAFVEVPLNASKLLPIVAQLCKLDVEVLLQKYAKISGAKLGPDDDMQIIKTESATSTGAAAKESHGKASLIRLQASAQAGDLGSLSGTGENSAIDTHAHQGGPGQRVAAKTLREKNYERFLASNDEPVDRVIAPKDLAKAEAKLRKDSEPEREELERIDSLKREFVAAMFKK